MQVGVFDIIESSDIAIPDQTLDHKTVDVRLLNVVQMQVVRVSQGYAEGRHAILSVRWVVRRNAKHASGAVYY